MNTFVVFAVGEDKPGIVAAVTGVLYEHGANLSDCSMTQLAGQFAMVVIVDVAAGETPEQLQTALQEKTAAFRLAVVVQAVEQRHTSRSATSVVLSVYGADKPGIVHQVANALAKNNVNITDLETRLIGDATQPVYTMLIELDLPADVTLEPLQTTLDALGTKLGVQMSLRREDADIL